MTEIMKSVNSPDDICLEHHAFIEASAGTGKTYTIENLVVRFILESRVNLDQILLVTFTEKATGELKSRIRERLLSKIIELKRSKDSHTEEIQRLEQALSDYSSARIHTIHGFCQSLLSEYCFENRNLFEQEVISSASLDIRAMKQVFRGQWNHIFGEYLPAFLSLAGFSKNGLQGSAFESEVLSVLNNWVPECGDELVPDVEPKKAQVLLHQLESLVKELKNFAPSKEKLDLWEQNKMISGTWSRDVFLPLQDLLSQTPMDWDEFSPIMSSLSSLKATVKKVAYKGIDAVRMKIEASKGAEEEQQEALLFMDKLAVSHKLYKEIRYCLAITAVRLIRTERKRLKEQFGYLTFDDMLIRVYEALSQDLFVSRVRDKIHVALVDEFQDTDPLQWEIFSRLFLNAGSKHRLLLIGDPKQAIYSFRGADIHSYLEARDTYVSMSESGFANLYSLNKNFRTIPGLLTHLNCLFSPMGEGQKWFSGEEKSSINYSPVQWPEELKPENQELVLNDKTGREELHFIEISDSDTAEEDYASAVASEILHLISTSSVRPGDMAILVQKRKEMLVFEAALRKSQIPYSCYKKPELFQSEEALWLSCIFQGVLFPGDNSSVKQAALTPFFGYCPQTLEKGFSEHGLKDVTTALRLLQTKALKKNWGAFLRILVEETDFQNYLLCSDSKERSYTNLKQILEGLFKEAGKQQLELSSMAELLDAYRMGWIEPPGEMDLHRIDSEESRVQLMTMHVSKGLEFPVVFIGGGFSGKRVSSPYLFHSGGKRIVQLSDDPDGKEKARLEMEQEEERLFYVALTRAAWKLYLPYQPLKKRGGGFLSSKLSSRIQYLFPEADYKQSYSKAEDFQFSVWEQSVEELKKDCVYHSPGEDFWKRVPFMSSFSSLNRHRSHEQKTGFHPMQAVKEPDEEHSLVYDYETPDLPAGASCGNVFHEILEQLDYSLASKLSEEEFGAEPDILKLAEGAVLRNVISKEHIPQILKLCREALLKPLPVPSNPRLCDISASQMRVEEEFLYPFPIPVFTEDGFSYERGYLRGAMDLIFFWENKIYLLDWKSNLSRNGYGPDALQNLMDDHGYDLQVTVYAIALLRWLRTYYPENFEQYFGGVIYVFLRAGTAEPGFWYKDSFPGLESLEQSVYSGGEHGK